MAAEDFTSYTLVGLRISKTATRCTAGPDLRRTDISYIYDDKGVSHFGDFEHLAKVRLLDSASAVKTGVWGLSNGAHTIKDKIDGTTGISVFLYFLNFRVYLYDFETGQAAAYENNSYYNKDLWLTIKRDGDTLTCKIYSDSGRTSLLDTLTISSCTETTFRYIETIHSEDNDTDSYRTSDAYIEELNLQESAEQAIAGALTFAGEAYKKTSTIKTGALTLAGSFLSSGGIRLEGAIANSGALIKKISKTLVGIFTSSGAVCRSKHLEGVFTSAGTVLVRILRGANADYSYRIDTETVDMDNLESLISVVPAGVHFRYHSDVRPSGTGVGVGSGSPQCEWVFDYLSWADLYTMLNFLGTDESVSLYINTRRPDDTYKVYSAIMHRPRIPESATQVIGGWRNVTFRFTHLEEA